MTVYRRCSTDAICIHKDASGCSNSLKVVVSQDNFKTTSRQLKSQGFSNSNWPQNFLYFLIYLLFLLTSAQLPNCTHSICHQSVCHDTRQLHSVNLRKESALIGSSAPLYLGSSASAAIARLLSSFVPARYRESPVRCFQWPVAANGGPGPS